MANDKNLKPFKKGDSRINVGGRPKWKHVTELMKTETNQEKLAVMVDKVFDLALEGNMRAVEFIADRLEGKVTQRVEVTTNDQPIKVFDFEGVDFDDDTLEVVQIGSKPKTSDR